MLSERRNHIPFVLSEVRVSHVFYFLAGANFMIIAFHCFYVQRCRTSYLNPSRKTCQSLRVASFSVVASVLLVSLAQIASSLSVAETCLLAEISL
ncbi:hypothetical protein EHC66_07160 [Vibrio parahaemolyticus]|nr:hypothetical protein EHC66_07160 [Vibrio parahaemolyticus]